MSDAGKLATAQRLKREAMLEHGYGSPQHIAAQKAYAKLLRKLGHG